MILLALRKVNHVFILGSDGIGTALMNTNTPTYDHQMSLGHFTLKGRTALPTNSAPCWGTLLHRVSPQLHKVFSNWRGKRTFWKSTTKYPSSFKLLHDIEPNAKMAVFSTWEIIPRNLIEDDIPVDRRVFKQYHDDQMVKEAIDYIKTEKPTLFFIAMMHTDDVGHESGFFSKKHYAAIRKADGKINELIQAIKDAGIYDDSLIMLVTDHGGGGRLSRHHGSDYPQDVRIFWSASAPYLKPKELDDFYIGDAAVYVQEALGLEAPEGWKNFDTRAGILDLYVIIALGVISGIAVIGIVVSITMWILLQKKRKDWKFLSECYTVSETGTDEEISREA